MRFFFWGVIDTRKKRRESKRKILYVIGVNT